MAKYTTFLLFLAFLPAFAHADPSDWAAYRLQQAEADLRAADAAVQANADALRDAQAQAADLSARIPQTQQDLRALQTQIELTRRNVEQASADLAATQAARDAARQALDAQSRRLASAQSAAQTARDAEIARFESGADMLAARNAVAEAHRRLDAKVADADRLWLSSDEYRHYAGAVADANARVMAERDDPGMYRPNLRDAQRRLQLAQNDMESARQRFLGNDPQVQAAQRLVNDGQRAMDRLAQDFRRSLDSLPSVLDAATQLAAQQRLADDLSTAEGRLDRIQKAQAEQSQWFANADAQVRQLQADLADQQNRVQQSESAAYAYQTQLAGALAAREQARFARDLAYEDYRRTEWIARPDYDPDITFGGGWGVGGGRDHGDGDRFDGDRRGDGRHGDWQPAPHRRDGAPDWRTRGDDGRDRRMTPPREGRRAPERPVPPQRPQPDRKHR